jgi:DNA-binding winged helix-turn-helix (wHTH) protein/TolB-like protein/Tfp pilus assembly protein PilF
MSKEPFNCYQFGPYRLDPNEGRLLRNGEPVPLTPKAFATLVVLVQRSGHLVEKDELIKLLWPDSVVEESNLNQHVWTLRKTLGENKAGNEYIETVPKRGYRFMAEVQELGHESFELVAERRTLTHIVTEDGVEASEGPRERLSESEARNLIAGRRRWVTRRRALAVGGLGLLLLTVSALTLRWWRSGEARRAEAPPAATRTNLTSMAILPFRPLVANDRDEYLEMGMVDVLITKLSNIRQLKVRSISTVRKYADLQQDPVAAGQELQVEAVLDGSIQRVGDRVRVTVRLLNVQDGTSLWADKFDEPFTNIFALQDSISERVAAALPLNLSGEEKARLSRHDTENTEAYQLYVKGRYFWNKQTEEGFRKGIDYFNQAIRDDPNYSLAYAGLSDCYALLSDFGFVPPGEGFPKAKEAATRALAIDEKLAEAHTSLGHVKRDYDWDWSGAEQEFRRAIELNPNYPSAHQWYAVYLSSLGRHQEAIAEIKRALELDPLSLPVNTVTARVLYLARQYDEAIEQSRKTIEMDPRFAAAYQNLGRSYEQKGMYAEAVATFQELNKAVPGHGLAFLARADALAGKTDEAQKILAQLKEPSARRYVSPYHVAMIYAGLGDKERTLAWLERAYQQRVHNMVFLKVEPELDGLRSDPRFADLMRRVGLTR